MFTIFMFFSAIVLLFFMLTEMYMYVPDRKMFIFTSLWIYGTLYYYGSIGMYYILEKVTPKKGKR
jgi:hypothetical protein